MTLPPTYPPVEALLDFFAAPDLGELVSKVDDKKLRETYAALMARLVELRDKRG
jgi:hypothetical protein